MLAGPAGFEAHRAQGGRKKVDSRFYAHWVSSLVTGVSTARASCRSNLHTPDTPALSARIAKHAGHTMPFGDPMTWFHSLFGANQMTLGRPQSPHHISGCSVSPARGNGSASTSISIALQTG